MVCVFSAFFKEIRDLWEEQLKFCRKRKEKFYHVKSCENYREFLLEDKIVEKFWFFCAWFVQESDYATKEMYSKFMRCCQSHLEFLYPEKSCEFEKTVVGWERYWKDIWGWRTPPRV